MNKKELTALLASRLGLPIRRTAQIIDTVLSTIVEVTIKDGRCLCGGHKFKMRMTSERAGRNPNTGEVLTIPAKAMVTYRKLVPVA